MSDAENIAEQIAKLFAQLPSSEATVILKKLHPKPEHKPWTPEDEAARQQMRASGATYKQISEALGHTKRKIKYYSYRKTSAPILFEPKHAHHVDDMRADWISGVHTKDIEARYNVSSSAFEEIRRKHNFTPRARVYSPKAPQAKVPKKFSEECIAAVRISWGNGMSLADMEKSFGLSRNSLISMARTYEFRRPEGFASACRGGPRARKQRAVSDEQTKLRRENKPRAPKPRAASDDKTKARRDDKPRVPLAPSRPKLVASNDSSPVPRAVAKIPPIQFSSTPGACQFPLGKTGRVWNFCCAPTPHHRIMYCPIHAAIAYVSGSKERVSA